MITKNNCDSNKKKMISVLMFMALEKKKIQKFKEIEIN